MTLKSKLQSAPYIRAAIFIFLLAPFCVWLCVWISEGYANPDKKSRIESFEVDVLGGATGISATLMRDRYVYDANGARLVTFNANISDELERYDNPAILVTRASRDISVLLDAELLSENRSNNASGLHLSYKPYLFEIPKAQAAYGNLSIIATAPDMQPALRRVYIGEYKDILRSYRWRSMIGVYLIVFATGITFMSALISLALAMVSVKQRRMIGSFSAVMLCWSVINLCYIGPTSLFSPTVERVIYTLSTFFMIVISVDFVNEWTFANKKIRNVWVPLFAVLLCGLSIPVLTGSHSIYLKMMFGADMIAIIGVGIMLFQIFWYLVEHEKAPRIQGFVFLCCIYAVMVDMLSYIIPNMGAVMWPRTDVTLHYGPVVTVFLGLTIISSFAREAMSVQKKLNRSNVELSEKLADREAEIANVYAQREGEMREAALMEERKRIMRDMHDGVGGRLLSLSLRAKRAELQGDTLSEELDESLQELRLIVDSMDTAEGDLDIALGALRGRIEPMLYDAGIELIWDAQDLGEHPAYGPREVLSIYRMVQESVSNAVRHSGASKLTFTTRCVGDSELQIVLTDNGRGIGEESVPGRGLGNIRTRAQALGGTAEIGNVETGGARISIRLPQNPSELTGITP